MKQPPGSQMASSCSPAEVPPATMNRHSSMMLYWSLSSKFWVPAFLRSASKRERISSPVISLVVYRLQLYREDYLVLRRLRDRCRMQGFSNCSVTCTNKKTSVFVSDAGDFQQQLQFPNFRNKGNINIDCILLKFISSDYLQAFLFLLGFLGMFFV